LFDLSIDATERSYAVVEVRAAAEERRLSERALAECTRGAFTSIASGVLATGAYFSPFSAGDTHFVRILPTKSRAD